MVHRKAGRRNGRPPLDDTGEGTRVSVRLSAAMYDAIYLLADEQDIDVAALIRDAIEQRLLNDRRTRPRLT